MSKKRQKRKHPASLLSRGLIVFGLLIAVSAVLITKREPAPQTAIRLAGRVI